MGGLPRRCRRGGCQRYPAEGLASALPARRASAIPGGGLPSLPPAYPATVVPAGGVPALSPAYTAFNLLPCPLPRRGRIDPRPPSRREGGDYRLFYARNCAPCIPGAEPARHWFALPLWKTQWGACLLCRLPTLPLTCFLAPIPPDPLPDGKGVTIGYFLQGASPLASPGLNPGGTGAEGEPRTRRGCAFGIANSPQNR